MNARTQELARRASNLGRAEAGRLAVSHDVHALGALLALDSNRLDLLFVRISATYAEAADLLIRRAVADAFLLAIRDGLSVAAAALVKAQVPDGRVEKFLNAICKDWLRLLRHEEPTAHDRMEWVSSLPAPA